jgi:hypothetical protein
MHRFGQCSRCSGVYLWGSGGARGCRHVRMMDETSVIGSGYDDHVEHARWTDDVGHKLRLIIKTVGSM